jgi:hypothetical protein
MYVQEPVHYLTKRLVPGCNHKCYAILDNTLAMYDLTMYVEY